MPEQLKNHREVVTLKDGTYVLIRPMTTDDYERLMEMYSAISDEDLHSFRHNVKDPETVRAWCASLDYNKVLPVLALVKERVIGSATLHFDEGPKRHVGEVRIYLAKEFRKRGLGMKMIRALIELARRQGLYVLIAEVIADHTKVIKAFEQLGFVAHCSLEDFFMFPDGDLTDVVLMTMNLHPKLDEF
ncbi:MAG: GNAT family N-acetyltransferase [Anaerolineales bacterium]|nr:GNAT family N-acetyltransferase [Anaerolineales bacterium]